VSIVDFINNPSIPHSSCERVFDAFLALKRHRVSIAAHRLLETARIATRRNAKRAAKLLLTLSQRRARHAVRFARVRSACTLAHHVQAACASNRLDCARLNP